MDTLERIQKITRDSGFDEKKKKPGLKFNPGSVLTGVQTTGPCSLLPMIVAGVHATIITTTTTILLEFPYTEMVLLLKYYNSTK